ncbi:hypothetical protein [uncultured Croceitalea sp.]|uniref:hypothetical protein n=1 Tax=uncultured Croceitalea sp. TaxID=1798908 RepID=UPI003305A24C
MQLKKKLQAFTLSEMLVVLLLTVVVVGLAFAILNLVQQQMNTAKNNFEKNTELNQLRQALWTDFRTYPKISYIENSQQLLLESETSNTSYTFFDSYILRNTDTLFIAIEEKKFYLEGKQVPFGLVNAMSLKTEKEMGSRNVFVYRENAANFYMNN